MLCPISFALFLSVHRRQQRNLQAAQSIIHGTIEESGVRTSTLGASQSTSPDESASNQVPQEMISQEEQEQGREKERHTQNE